jgi:hypothetical protein
MLKEKLENDFRRPRYLLNGQSDSPNGRDNPLFLWDDEEVRLLLITMMKSQIHVAASEF